MEHTISQVGQNAKTAIQVNWVGVRGNREPIDSSSVMLTYTELNDYISYNKSVYDGQLVSVSDMNDTTYNGIYYIKYFKDENNNYSYTANKISLHEFSKLLENNIITDERVVSLMNNYIQNNICKNEEVISLAINYLYSYIESKSDVIQAELQRNESILSDYLTYIYNTFNNITIQYASLPQELRDYTDNKVSQLEAKHDREKSALDTTISNLEAKHDRDKSALDTAISNLEAKHDREKSALDTAISNLETKHNRELSALTQQHNNDISRLSNSISSGDTNVKNYVDSQISALRQQHNNDINNLSNNFNNNITNLRNELIGHISNIYSLIGQLHNGSYNPFAATLMRNDLLEERSSYIDIDVEPATWEYNF